MTIKKIRCNNIGIITTDTYYSTVHHIDMLYNEVCKDFTGISDHDVHVVTFGGRDHA